MLTLILGMGCQQPSGQTQVVPEAPEPGTSDSQDTALPKDTEKDKDTSSPEDSGDTDSGETDSGDKIGKVSLSHGWIGPSDSMSNRCAAASRDQILLCMRLWLRGHSKKPPPRGSTSA